MNPAILLSSFMASWQVYATDSQFIMGQLNGKVELILGPLDDHVLTFKASSCNAYIKTFAGIDGAGKRLADEVMLVVKRTESLKKISFIAHSLGGLIARYAVAVLFTPNVVKCATTNPGCYSNKGLIAGLEPINFITLATPHLGVRGNKQFPILLGVPILEKLAAPMAALLTRKTGRQLFLTDGKPNVPPLLLRMASDCEDMKFISSLGAFKCRSVYANASYDYLVGWRTSSIRRDSELPKPPKQSLDGYKHVVNVEYCPPNSSDAPHFPPEAAKAKEAAQNEHNTTLQYHVPKGEIAQPGRPSPPTRRATLQYHEIMEEEMMKGLQQIGWMKVDVSFHSALWPCFAHNNIHVKNQWFHNAGAGVISHVADSIKQQEKLCALNPAFVASSL